MKRIVIVGGGMTGLSTAFTLQREIDQNSLPIQVTLVEAENHLGGKIKTEHRDGFVIERGPDSFLARKKSMAQLIEKLGISTDLVHNQTGQAHILHLNKLHPIPEGAVMGIPTKVTPFLFSELFSIKGKLRAGLDLILPKSDIIGDQSIGSFFRRRLGDEVVEQLIEPLLSGVYAGNINRISLQSTFPQFQQIETNHRSLILGMKRTRPDLQKEAVQKGAFLTLKKGLDSVVKKMENHLTPAVEIRKGQRVVGFKRNGFKYTISLNNGEALEASQVIFALPGLKAASLFSTEIKTPLQQIPATSVATVAMAFPESAISEKLNGTGFIVSKKSPYTITACTWTDKKWPHTTPAGSVLLRCYVGRESDQSIVEEDDETILEAVMSDMKKIMGIQQEPNFYYITRWKQAMPQYLVGHEEQGRKLRELLEENYPGVQLVGASFDGIGLPDCVLAGEKAAMKAIAALHLSN